MGKFSNILIVSDLDGTFLGAKSELLDNNIEAVEYFKQNGGHFTFATGRMHKNILDVIPYPEKLVNEVTIMANGTYTFDWHNQKLDHEKFIPKKEFRAVLKYVKENYPEIGIRLACSSSIVTDKLSGYILKDLRKANARGDVNITTFDEMAKLEDCYKAVFRADAKILDKMRAELYEEGLMRELNGSKSSANCYEIQSGDSDKARGLSILREKLENQHGKFIVYACGDHENDIAMLEAADIAICPANAIDEVKQISDFCLCKNTEGLIAEIIKMIDEKVSPI